MRKALLRANLPFGGKASQPMSLDEYCFKHEPADYNVYWDVRKGLIPIVGAARETGALGRLRGPKTLKDSGTGDWAEVELKAEGNERERASIVAGQIRPRTSSVAAWESVAASVCWWRKCQQWQLLRWKAVQMIRTST